MDKDGQIERVREMDIDGQRERERAERGAYR